jgi:hypothetical protein
MFNFRFGVVGALAVAAMSLTNTAANAVACGTGGDLTYDLTITSASGTASCWGFGNGNLSGLNNNPNLVTTSPGGVPNGTNPIAFVGGYTYLGDLGILASTTLTGVGPQGPGTWSFTASGGFTYLLGLKAGLGQNDQYEWAVYSLTGLLAGLASGSWQTFPGVNAGGLSHVGLYRSSGTGPDPGPEPGQTPIPGAAFLMGSVLAGGAGFGAWRRRRREKFAA